MDDVRCDSVSRIKLLKDKLIDEIHTNFNGENHKLVTAVSEAALNKFYNLAFNEICKSCKEKKRCIIDGEL